jgi:hypothetical protein
VTYPHHPLYKQTVKVLRRAGNRAYPEPCYWIELPDGTRAELRVSWIEVVEPDEATTALDERIFEPRGENFHAMLSGSREGGG